MSDGSTSNRTLGQAIADLPTELLERLHAAHEETILLSASLKKQDAELATVTAERDALLEFLAERGYSDCGLKECAHDFCQMRRMGEARGQ